MILGNRTGYIVDLPDGCESRVRYLATTQDETIRTEFRISSRWQLPDPTGHISGMAGRMAKHFAVRPHCTLPFEDEARRVMLGNQVASGVVDFERRFRHNGRPSACICVWTFV